MILNLCGRRGERLVLGLSSLRSMCRRQNTRLRLRRWWLQVEIGGWGPKYAGQGFQATWPSEQEYEEGHRGQSQNNMANILMWTRARCKCLGKAELEGGRFSWSLSSLIQEGLTCYLCSGFCARPSVKEGSWDSVLLRKGGPKSCSGGWDSCTCHNKLE